MRSSPIITSSVVVALVLTAASVASGGPDVRVECESYTDFYNEGGAEIASVVCSSASDGLAVDGLDIIGEWIEVKATLPTESCYDLTLSYQAPYGETIGMLLTVFDDAHQSVDAESEFSLIGMGLG